MASRKAAEKLKEIKKNWKLQKELKDKINKQDFSEELSGDLKKYLERYDAKINRAAKEWAALTTNNPKTGGETT